MLIITVWFSAGKEKERKKMTDPDNGNERRQLLRCLDRLSSLALDIPGIPKLQALIRADLKRVQPSEALAPLKAPDCAHGNTAAGSNVPYFSSLLDVLECRPDIISVLEPVRNPEGGSVVRVDIVAERGRCWIKVKGSNSRRMASVYPDEESESDSDAETVDDVPLIKQLRVLKRLASVNQVHYQAPKIALYFGFVEKVESLDPTLAQALADMDVEMIFARSGLQARAIPCGRSLPMYADTLLLDVTSLIALCSLMSHVSGEELARMRVGNSVLALQLEEERVAGKRAVLDILLPLFSGRRLVTVSDAVEKVELISKTIAGQEEKSRVASLCTLGIPGLEIGPIQVLPRTLARVYLDHEKELKERCGALNVSVFGTGHQMQATIVTANKSVAGFLEREYGTSVVVHAPRAFVEQKSWFT
ncbi:MAG: hypothetical protein SGCHY_005042 [Lobulomycetales sp.]